MKIARFRALALALLCFSCLSPAIFGASGCKPAAEKLSPKSQTSAELRAIRRGVSVVHPGQPGRAPYAKERLGEGAEVLVEDGGLAWLRRDGGATLLVRGPAKLKLESEGVRISDGLVFAETTAGQTEKIMVPEGPLVLSAVRASLEVRGGKTEAYVLQGEVRTDKIAARAGELLSLAGDGAVRPAVAWEDWTGGLATTDRGSDPAPYGVGTVGARVPGALGAPHSPLSIQRLDVRVTIDGDLAVTEIDQTFFNPQSQTVEGLYRFRVPEGAMIERFGVDRGGDVVFGYVKEKNRAEAQYQKNVYVGSKEDPALLAWKEPGVYEARLYPIAAGETRRVIVRYSEWLHRSGEKGERRLYVYPMASEGSEASAPNIEDLSIRVDLAKAGAKELRAGMEAERLADELSVVAHDLVPRADFALELFDDGPKKLVAVRAAHRPDPVMLGPEEAKQQKQSAQSENDYLMVPIVERALAAPDPGLDLVVVVDTSAGTDAARLRLARATTRALLAHLGSADRALVLAGDDRLSPVTQNAELAPVTQELRNETQKALATLRSGGATDLATMLYEATTKLGDKRQTAIVYLGDGAPTVGEIDLASIRDKLKGAPRKVRIFGLGMGDDANMALIEGLSSSGFAARVADERSAAQAALSVLELAERPAVLDLEIDLGPSLERVYPREATTLVAGQTLFAIGRLVGDPPESVTIKHSGKSQTFPLEIATMDDRGDLRRRWAAGRLDELLTEAAGPAALVDLGVRQGIITPYTSIYVPTAKEMTAEQREQAKAETRKRSVQRRLEDETREAAREKQKEQDKSKGKRGFFDSLIGGSKDEATASASAPEDSDNKEGGTGARAKGEEGKMAQATASPAAVPPAENAAEPEVAKPQRLAKAVQEAETKPNEDTASAPDPSPAAAPKAQAPAAPGAGGKPTGGSSAPDTLADKKLDRDGDGLDDGRNTLEVDQENVNLPRTGDSGVLALEGNDGSARDNSLDSGGDFRLGLNGIGEGGAGRGEGQGFGSGHGRLGGSHKTDAEVQQRTNGMLVIIIDDPGRKKKLCGPGAELPLGERMSLWRERLAKTGGAPSGMVRVYRQALMLCEAPTIRERRALLLLGLDFLPTISAKVAAYRLLERDLGASDIVYRAILGRISRPEEAREFNAALGLASVDPQLLEKTIKEAKDAGDLVKKLRALTTRFPGDLDLALHLLDALEDANDEVGARGLASELRARSDANAQVRTAVGELFLRLGARHDDNAQKLADEREAKRAFGEIVEFSPSDPVARRRLGDLYRAHGYYQEAARQYETLASLVPDDPTVYLLAALSANGLGKLEEAVRWTEKGGQAGAPDATQGPHATARAMATVFLAWGRIEAREKGNKDELTALTTRLERVLGAKGLERSQGNIKILVTWAHPEFHPALWTDALGTLMPASEGDPTLGILQALAPAKNGARIELRLEPRDVERAARLGQKATVTVIFDEGQSSEVVIKKDIGFSRNGPASLKLFAKNGSLEEVSK